jgi:acetate kinase
MRVLALDSGSSSLKYALIDMPAERQLEAAALDTKTVEAQRSAVLDVVPRMQARGCGPEAIGHRVVFGGPAHTQPERVDEQLVRSLERLGAFDPVHMPAALATIRAAREAAPAVPAVACFDSAFHHAMPELAQRYPLPNDVDPVVRRYGYHGLSYEYVVAALGLRGRAIIAHLGNGASMAATRDGCAIDTTMGFTPLGGMMMGTRPGDLDPGVLVYLATAGGYSPSALSELLNKKSGLLGVSGSTADMRALLERSPHDARAQAAVDLFVYSAAKQLGGLASALGGLDTLVFTGGIGENAWQIREAICKMCAHLGMLVDPVLNRQHAEIVSQATSPVAVRVVKTNESLMIARHVVATLPSQPSK